MQRTGNPPVNELPMKIKSVYSPAADGAAESYIHSFTDFDDINKLYEPVKDYLQKFSTSIWFIVINFIQRRGFAYKNEKK